MNKLFTKKDLKMLFIAIMSALIEAFAITSFVNPGNFMPAGVSGICRLTVVSFKDYFNLNVSYSILYFSINVILAFIVYKEIGKRFTIYTLIQNLLTSIFIANFKPILSISEPLLLAIFGGIIKGLSCGIALSNELSTGGTDYLNVYFSSKYNRSIINYVLYLNIFVLIVFGLLYGWEVSMISIIFQYVSTQVIKQLHNRYTNNTITIITKMPKEITNELFKNVRHGITITNAKGAYNSDDIYILYTVVNTFQTQLVINTAKKIDPQVFINVQESKEISGNYYQVPLS